MSSKRLVWDKQGERLFETGVEQGVLYPFENEQYSTGVAWNGITSVDENPSGAEPTALYADNIKYLNLLSNEEFGCSVEAYTYPDEFKPCAGELELAPGVTAGQQEHKPFGLSYKTRIGNDTDGSDHGYKLHLIYGCLAQPSEKGYSTINDSPEAISFSWEISTTPVPVPGGKPTSTLTIDSTKTDKAKMKAIEDILYGTENTEPRLPLPEEVIRIMKGETPKETTEESEEEPAEE